MHSLLFNQYVTGFFCPKYFKLCCEYSCSLQFDAFWKVLEQK